ncbi:MAG: hypothetical protein ABIR24_14900 [Verrucomicrobiota bacterium]
MKSPLLILPFASKHTSFALIGMIACGALFAFETALAAERSSETLPKFSGHELPQPPEQQRPWRAPSGDFPTNLISSVATLFDLGLTDPRGCEYREYETVVGTHAKAKAHGWILPSRSETEQRFAVTWAGTLYPVLSVGEKANLSADVEALLRDDESRRKAASDDVFGQSRWSPLPTEWISISQTNMTEIKVALLLRLGEGDLAWKYWNAWRAPGSINQSKEDAHDPFRTLAFYWAWAQFDRAICAHMRGDDNLALADCRNLSNVWPRLEREVARRGFARFSSVTPNQDRDWFEFLEPVKELLIDQERRAKEPPREPEFANITDSAKRIAALISRLDELAEIQWRAFWRESTWKALVAEGENAVEPLLDCLENDSRLTRSISSYKNFSTHRNILPVRAAAEAALNEILKVNFRNKNEYRAHWNRYKNLNLVERWYRILADDQAGREQWMQTAQNVLSRSDGKTMFLWKNAPIPNRTNQFHYVADKLRSKTQPSISDLLIKRALNIAPTNYSGSSDCWAFDEAADLGLMLAEWNPKTAKGALGKIIERCPVFYASRQTFNSGCGSVIKNLAALVTKLADLGDTTGLDLYANWVRDQKLEDIRDGLPEVLKPLGAYPRHPSIQKVSVELLRPEKGDWLSRRFSSDLLRTRLVLNEAFRLLILEGLESKAEAGTIILTDGGFDIRAEGGSQGGILTPDAFAPKSGTSVSFRECDHIAHRLSRIVGLPKLELYWPEAKRDEALGEIVRFLKENGDNLKLKPASWPDND